MKTFAIEISKGRWIGSNSEWDVPVYAASVVEFRMINRVLYTAKRDDLNIFDNSDDPEHNLRLSIEALRNRVDRGEVSTRITNEVLVSEEML